MMISKSQIVQMLTLWITLVISSISCEYVDDIYYRPDSRNRDRWYSSSSSTNNRYHPSSGFSGLSSASSSSYPSGSYYPSLSSYGSGSGGSSAYPPFPAASSYAAGSSVTPQPYSYTNQASYGTPQYTSYSSDAHQRPVSQGGTQSYSPGSYSPSAFPPPYPAPSYPQPSYQTSYSNPTYSHYGNPNGGAAGLPFGGYGTGFGPGSRYHALYSGGAPPPSNAAPSSLPPPYPYNSPTRSDPSYSDNNLHTASSTSSYAQHHPSMNSFSRGQYYGTITELRT